MHTNSHDLAEHNAAFERKITEALETLKRWGERRGFSGRLKIALLSLPLTCKKQATLTPPAPGIFTRSNATFLERPLTEDELNEIAAVKWNPKLRRIIDHCLLHHNEPLLATDLDRILFPELDRPIDQLSGNDRRDYYWEARSARRKLWEILNARLRSIGLPYRWTWPIESSGDQGPYRFYRTIETE